MSCFDRWRVALSALSLLGVAGCGFVPVAAVPDQSGDLKLAVSTLQINGASSAFEYDLRKQLRPFVVIDPSAPDTLSLDISIESEGLAIEVDDTISRQRLIAQADFKLADKDPETEDDFSGSISSSTSVNATTDFFATLASRREAERSLAVDVGSQVVSVLYGRRLQAP